MKAIKKPVDPPKKATPARDTIYVTDPNHSWLKAYQDSSYVRTLLPQTFRQGTRTRPLTLDEKIFWKDEKTGLVPNLVEYDPKTKLDYFGHFKKPVRHVEYKKNEKVNIAPKELTMPKPSIKVQKTVKLPSAIRDIKYDTQKGTVLLDLDGTNRAMPRKDFTTWVNKPENRKMFDDYRKAKAKK
jgi:hypothetical protein